MKHSLPWQSRLLLLGLWPAIGIPLACGGKGDTIYIIQAHGGAPSGGAVNPGTGGGGNGAIAGSAAQAGSIDAGGMADAGASDGSSGRLGGGSTSTGGSSAGSSNGGTSSGSSGVGGTASGPTNGGASGAAGGGGKGSGGSTGGSGGKSTGGVGGSGASSSGGVSGSGGASGSCRGTAVLCNQFDTTHCEAQPGCVYNGRCVGTTVECPELNGLGEVYCNLEPNCQWDTNAGTCKGEIPPLCTRRSVATCLSLGSGCWVDEGCFGSPYSCSLLLLPDACAQEVGCTWQ